MKVARVLGLFAGVCAFAFAPAARANGRYPAANQIVVSPSDPGALLTRSTFGLLLSRDRGATWDWICETALGFTDTQDPSVGILTANAIVAGTYGGLVVSPDTGCSWGFVGGPLAQVPIVDIVVRRESPSTAYALASKHSGDSDAGDPLYLTQVYATTNAGATWAPVGSPIDASTLVETIEIAKSDPSRFYVSGIKGSGASSTAAFYASTDAGKTWTEHDVPFDPANERAPYIAAVDPANADRVYVRNGGPSSSRLFVTDDAGQTFAQKWSGGVMLGFALSPDGAKVYVGGPSDGVQVASTADFQFTKKSSTAVECLTSTGTTLYACAGEKSSGFSVGASTDDGATFTPLLHLSTIRGPIQCAADAAAAECAQEWPSVGGVLGAYDAGASGDDSGAGPGPSDSGAKTDGGVPGTGASGGGSSSCGCREASPATGSLSAVAIALAALVGMRTRYKK